jgi:hypothetical protein
VNGRWFTVVAFDDARRRKVNQAIRTWRGEVSNSGSSCDFRHGLHFVRIPVIDGLGKHQRRKSTVMFPFDSRVRALQAP